MAAETVNVRHIVDERPAGRGASTAPPTAWPATASAPFQARRRAATSPPLWTTSTSKDRDDSFATEAAASGASRRPPLAPELGESEQRPTRGAGTCWLLLPRGCGHLRPPDAAHARSGRRLARKQPRRSSVLRVISRWLPRRMIAGSLRQPTMWATSGSRKPATSPAVSVATRAAPGNGSRSRSNGQRAAHCGASRDRPLRPRACQCASGRGDGHPRRHLHRRWCDPVRGAKLDNVTPTSERTQPATDLACFMSRVGRRSGSGGQHRRAGRSRAASPPGHHPDTGQSSHPDRAPGRADPIEERQQP